MNADYLSYLPYVIAGVFVVVAVASLLWRTRLEKARTEAIRELSYTIGFDYSESDDSILASPLGGLPLFQKGQRQRVSNVLRRSDQRGQRLLFDYRYTIGSGKNSSTHRQTLAAFLLDEIQLPDIELRPETIFHRIGSGFGYQDIDFDGFPEFSGSYLLRGKDEAAIRQAFGPSVLQALERQTGWWVEASGGSIVAYRHNKRVKPSDLFTFSQQSNELVHAITDS